MGVPGLVSVVSGAVVVAALSSTAAQLQPATVLVSPAPPVPAGTVSAPAVPVPAQAAAAGPGVVAAPARPAYVLAGNGQVALRTAGGRATVDVLGCSTGWSRTGECPGVQSAVVRDAPLEAAVTALPVPAGTPHLRVSVAGGAVTVGDLP